MMYQRLFDQGATVKPDSEVLAGAFVTLSTAIVGSRGRLEKAWREVLGAKNEYKLVWKTNKRRRKTESA
jgi:hypothetical protein